MTMRVHRCWEVDDCFHPTRRDLELITLIADGLPSRRIALHMGLAPSTVKNLLSTLYDRLHVGCRAHLVRRAFELGLLSIEAKSEAVTRAQ